MHIRTYTHTHTHAHTHTYTHAHTHTHTRLYTQWGETALHIAVHEEHEDIVELLLEANADSDLPMKVIHPYRIRQPW